MFGGRGNEHMDHPPAQYLGILPHPNPSPPGFMAMFLIIIPTVLGGTSYL